MLAERTSPAAVKLANQVALTQQIGKRIGLAHAHSMSQKPLGNLHLNLHLAVTSGALEVQVGGDERTVKKVLETLRKSAY